MQGKAENLRQLFGELLNRMTEGKAKGQAGNTVGANGKRYEHVS